MASNRVIESLRRLRARYGNPTKRCSVETEVHQRPWSRLRRSATNLVVSTRERTRQHFGRATPEQCAATCDELLRLTVRTPFRTYYRAGLYTVELAAPSDPAAPVLLLTHGYGVGSGLWCYLLDLLAPHFRVYAVDWLGCGASERPPWPRAASTPGAAESFFTDSLHTWVESTPAVAGQPFALAGHSLGGYLSSAYVLRHPGRVAALALLSPAGLSAAAPLGRAPSHLHQQQLTAAQRRSWAIRLLSRAWDAGVTPQSIVRGLGRWGEAWAGRTLSSRFDRAAEAHLLRQHRPLPLLEREPVEAPGADAAAASPPHGDVLAQYLYQITAAPGSGEHALSRLLVFGGAHAREAMAPRLVAAAGAVFPASVTVLYGGTHDWMPAQPGFTLATDLRGRGVDALAGLTPHSGHHLHMESPVAVAQVLRARMAAATKVAAATQVAASRGSPQPRE